MASRNHTCANYPDNLSNLVSVSDVVQASMNLNYVQTSVPTTYPVNSGFSNDSKFFPREVSSKKSSRALRRQNNDNLKGNPFAILNPKDLTPPGFTLETPNFHFKPQHFEPAFISFEFESPKEIKTRPSLPSKQFKNIRKNPHVHKILPKFESDLREFISVFKSPKLRSVSHELISINTPTCESGHEDLDETWDHLATDSYTDVKIEHEVDLDAVLISAPRVESHHLDPEVKVSVKAMPNSFHRLLMHTLCEYYNILSYSRNEPQGYRSIVICQPGVSLNNGTKLKKVGWVYPTKLFCDFLFLQNS